MKKRLEALQKIGRLQKQMHDLAIWRLTALDRAREELAESHRQMLDALASGFLSFGAPALAATRRVRALEKEIAAAAAECETQTKRVLDQGVRAKLADRAYEDAGAEYREQRQRKELAELIDRSVNNPKSSSA
jgi:hypothetical protein